MLLHPMRGKTDVPKLQAAALLSLFRVLMHLLLLQYMVPPFQPNKENPPPRACCRHLGRIECLGMCCPLLSSRGWWLENNQGLIMQ